MYCKLKITGWLRRTENEAKILYTLQTRQSKGALFWKIILHTMRGKSLKEFADGLCVTLLSWPLHFQFASYTYAHEQWDNLDNCLKVSWKIVIAWR